MWYTRNELARDSEVLHPQWGVLYKSGVYAWKVLCLTPGGLFCALGSRVMLFNGSPRPRDAAEDERCAERIKKGQGAYLMADLLQDVRCRDCGKFYPCSNFGVELRPRGGFAAPQTQHRIA